MLASVRGYYDGKCIVLEEKVRLFKGQKLIITVLDDEKSVLKSVPDLTKYMGRGKSRIGKDAQEYIKEMRNNDRI